jgi:DNA-binding NtrC family response regulator
MGSEGDHWLVVEDNACFARRICAELRSEGLAVTLACSVAEAKAVLSPAYRVLLLDVELPDGTARDVVEALSYLPCRPLVLVMSAEATPTQAFELGRLGVREFVQKPSSAAALIAAAEHAAVTPPNLEPWVRSSVGYLPLFELEAQHRRQMIEEALGRAEQCKSGAARLLKISRQALQHLARSIKD